MPGLIGKKIGMTSVYNADGKSVAATLVQAGPCVVTQVKNDDSDGYTSVQLSFGDRKEKNTPKSLQGHYKKADTTPKSRSVEFRIEDVANFSVGDVLHPNDIFEEGDFIDIAGKSKGKGFQGVVKRHGFGGVGQATHGQHNRQRHPGAIGACSYPSRVFKGLKMAGRTGNKRVKVLNLKVLKIYPDENLILISGAIPGPKNSFVILEK